MDDLDLDALERACCNVPPYTVDKWRERGDVGDASIVDADDNEIAEMRAWDMGAVHAYMAATAPATVLALITRLRAAEARLNTPELHDFAAGVVAEAAHQRDRWGSEHDAGKAPADWFWLLGYLGGKALAAALAGNTEKALHHCISSAAALANWHAALSGQHTGKPLPHVHEPPGEPERVDERGEG
jgi:hypothetical protein